MSNQEETFSRLSGEIRVQQKGWYKKGRFFGLLFRDCYFFSVRTCANGKTFWFRYSMAAGNSFNPQAYLDTTIMRIAVEEALSKLNTPKRGTTERTLAYRHCADIPSGWVEEN